MQTSSELLSNAPETLEQQYSRNAEKGAPIMTQDWWQDARQDADVAERDCPACRGRGLTRWREDCPECGGLGVCFD